MIMLSRSALPVSAPSAQMLSYSGPSLYPIWKGPLGTFVILPQPVGQPQQALFLIRYFSAMYSPLCSSAFSKTPVWKFLVG